VSAIIKWVVFLAVADFNFSAACRSFHMGTFGTSMGIERPGLEVLSSADVSVWSYTFTVPYVFVTYRFKNTDRFTSTLWRSPGGHSRQATGSWSWSTA